MGGDPRSGRAPEHDKQIRLGDRLGRDKILLLEPGREKRDDFAKGHSIQTVVHPRARIKAALPDDVALAGRLAPGEFALHVRLVGERNHRHMIVGAKEGGQDRQRQHEDERPRGKVRAPHGVVLGF